MKSLLKYPRAHCVTTIDAAAWNSSSTTKAQDSIVLLRGNVISSPKPIQIILARQLASCLATPILIVDTEATLIFYNEPAEVILDQRFEETAEIPADTWSGRFAVADEARNPIAQEDRPMMMALSERKPYSRTVWMRCGHPREWTSGGTLAAGADLLIHDGQYSAAEYSGHCGWGHSSLNQTLDFGTLTEVKQLVPFHHDPDHTDADLDRLIAQAIDESKPDYRVTPGIEGTVFEL